MAQQSTSTGNGSNESFSNLGQRAWKIYRALSDAPEELTTVRDGILSVFGALRLLDEQLYESKLSALDRNTLRQYIDRVNTILSGLESALQSLRAGNESLDGVSTFAQKLILLATRLASFLEVLKRHSKEKLVDSLERLREGTSEEFQQSLVGSWNTLVRELQKLGLPQQLIEDEYFFINSSLKDISFDASGYSFNDAARDAGPSERVTFPEAVTARRIELAPSQPEQEELPDYTPGERRVPTVEKSRELDETTAALTSASIIPQIGSNSKSAPPAYTFEDGDDQEMDDEFLQHIRRAVEREARAQFLDRQNNPDQGPHPYDWLPRSLQERYARSPEIVSLMDPKSFSVMAYETAPRCMTEIQRLLPLLRVSVENKSHTTEGALGEAIESLKLLSTVLPKFVAIQNQRSVNERFSDLDILDFEYSTVSAFNEEKDLEYPEREFEHAQKSYYRLLTYIMGMLELFTDIFPGRTYVTRPKEQLDQLWQERRMATRTAWVAKQLTAWDEVETSAQVCRDWHRLRPDLSNKALNALKHWHKSQAMLISADIKDDIYLTIASATGLPKLRIGLPNVLVKLAIFGSDKAMSGSFVRFEYTTQIAKNTQSPVWNEEVLLKCPKFPKFMKLEVCERALGSNKPIAVVRLSFSFLPGTEMSLADRSLMFGMDDEISLPLTIEEGKGKEISPPELKLGFRWRGRMAMLEDAGLPVRPPGKLFRAGYTGVPMPVEGDSDTVFGYGGNRGPQPGRQS